MHHERLDRWQHSHAFGQEQRRLGESRTLIVIALTSAMMVVEIAAGVWFGSMALLADGLHMASHAGALSITALAYVYARRHALDPRYSFGTGKVNALGGFTGAILLALFALLMVWESIERLISPVEIAFDQAVAVAVLGLVVNGASVFILGHQHEHAHAHGHGAAHEHPEYEHHHPHRHHDHDHDHGHGEEAGLADSHGRHSHGHHHDHNLRSAYLHVLADALTSLLAIFALLGAKFFGLAWMDPLMGVIGAALVSRWSLGLLRSTSAVLLDRQGPDAICRAIRERIESDGDARLADLHLWSIGPNIYAAILSVVAHDPCSPEDYKARLPARLGLVHVTVEVHACSGQPAVPELAGQSR
ncbi:MAG TPA: cation diffusion facilitator family transporter [Limnochordia bacterium]